MLLNHLTEITQEIFKKPNFWKTARYISLSVCTIKSLLKMKKLAQVHVSSVCPSYSGVHNVFDFKLNFGKVVPVLRLAPSSS